MKLLSDNIFDILGESFDLSNQFSDLSLPAILAAMGTAAVCGLIIYFIYKMFYKGIVYNENFNILLVIVTVVTSFIIMTISANIVLSLGMVGALSIVRFRSAIKEPLDVGFLFWGIAAGITSGAGLYFVAIIGTAVVGVIYIALTFVKKQKRHYLLIVRYDDSCEENIAGLLSGMKYRLKNKTCRDNGVELTIEVNVKNNDTSYISRFKGVDGVQGVTLLEYSGEYLN